MTTSKQRRAPQSPAIPTATTTALALPEQAHLSDLEILQRRLAQMEAENLRLRAEAEAKPAKVAKPATATDYRRTVDLAIIMAAGDLVDQLVPEPLRPEVRRLVANQLHHLSTPAQGWPSATLPVPDRSDWR